MRRRWPWALLIVAAIIATALMINAYVRSSKEVEVVVTHAAAVPAQHQSAVLNASGYVIARRQATVSSKVVGRVSEVLVEEGALVEAGAVLARLDAASARKQLEAASAELDAVRKTLAELHVRNDEARRRVQRVEQLHAQSLVSTSERDIASADLAASSARIVAAEAQVAVAEGALRVKRQELTDLEVRAPFDGVVVSKDAQPGETVSPSAGAGFTRTGIATIVDMSSREIQVDVNESFISRVQAGQAVQAVLDAYPDVVFDSHVINVVPTADRQKATVRVRIAFDSLDPRILPEMGVKVSFLEAHDLTASTQRSAAARIPSAALSQDAQGDFVWRVRDSITERVGVRKVGERDGSIEVTGVEAGDAIVIAATGDVRNGSKVRIKSS